MNIEELKKLAFALTKCKKDKKINFSLDDGTTLNVDDMQDTLRNEIFDLCKNQLSYEKNKYDLFALISESIDMKMPPELEKIFEGVAKVVQYGETDKPEVTVRRSKRNLRGRSFVTKVSPAGIYEVFRLGKEGKVTIEMCAVGGAAQIAYQDFYTGRIDWNELIDILTLGMQDRIYEEILKTLEKIENSLPAANKAETDTFDAKALNKVLDVVSVYGSPVIYCTETFAREITEGYDWASEREKDARRKVGYLADYKNARIVIIPQTYSDETNSHKMVDSSKAYIFPSGENGIFHVALQGDTHIKEVESNSDWSKEIHAYRKFGVAAFVYNDIATYTITSLKD